MQSKFRRIVCFVLFVFFIFPVGTALGYSTVVSYGDSLSDDGNFGRYTDGAVWVESLAGYYGGTLIDHAYGGATTSYDNPAAVDNGIPAGSHSYGLKWQVETFSSELSILPNDTLITLWAGGNDFLQMRDVTTAVLNIEYSLGVLYNSGGRDFLVPNLPNIGSTPAALGGYLPPNATPWTMDFNYQLDSMLNVFANSYTDVNLFAVDTFTLFEHYPVGSAEWLNLFWVDGFHPSSAGHELVFNAAISTLEPTPEPTTFLLFCTGLAGIVGFSRRRSVAERT